MESIKELYHLLVKSKLIELFLLLKHIRLPIGRAHEVGFSYTILSNILLRCAMATP